MDLSLTADQKLMKEEARRLLSKEATSDAIKEWAGTKEGYSIELWKKMVDLDWLALVIPERYGGCDWSFFDLLILLEEMGRVCLPGPFFSTQVGTMIILESQNDNQKEALLPQIVKGKRILTVALDEPDFRDDLNEIKSVAKMRDQTYILNGTKIFVENAHLSDLIITITNVVQDQLSSVNLAVLLVDTNAPGVEVAELNQFGTDRQYEVVFNQVECPIESLLIYQEKGKAFLKQMLPKIALAKAAEMLGGTERVFELATKHAKQRKQFGAAIGSYQMVQSHCADMKIAIDAMRELIYFAGWRVVEGLPYEKEAAMAKVWTDQIYRKVCSLSIQIHGALGFTEESELSTHWVRSKKCQMILGNYNFLSGVIAEKVGLTG